MMPKPPCRWTPTLRRGLTLGTLGALAVACLAVACRDVAGATDASGGPPAADARPQSAIPDTVVRSPGLPPRTTDSTTRALGPAGDTLVVTSVAASPPWSAPSQLPPG